MEPEKKPKHIEDKRLIFSHKNLQRWALFATNPWVGKRVLERYGPDGTVIDRCEIGTWEINGRHRTLGVEEGSMMNLIEALHDRLRPPDGVLKVPTSEFYDFVVDIASLRDATRRKKRHSIEHRDYVYNKLYLLTAVSIMWSDWKEKDGTGSAQRFNLLDGFKIYGKTEGAKWGEVEIKINPIVAAGLRNRHTTPILVEVANSFKAPMAWILYRYIDKVLAKTLDFKLQLEDLAKRLAIIDRKDELVRKVRAAVKEMQGKDITSGRISKCVLEKKDRAWWFFVTRDRRTVNRPPKNDNKEKINNEEIENKKEINQIDVYVARFNAMDPEKRKPLEEKVQARLAQNKMCGQPGQPGYDLLRSVTIADVMEDYFINELDHASYKHCSKDGLLIAREAPTPGTEYLSDKEHEERLKLSAKYRAEFN